MAVPTMEATPKDQPGEKYIINVSAFDAEKWIAWEEYRLQQIFEQAKAAAAAGKAEADAAAEAMVTVVGESKANANDAIVDAVFHPERKPRGRPKQA